MALADTEAAASAGPWSQSLEWALSNVFDRLRIGAVVDYLDFHAWNYHWPAFNFADAAIVCGVAILVLEHVMALPDDREGQRELR